jgi:hypothetical protein
MYSILSDIDLAVEAVHNRLGSYNSKPRAEIGDNRLSGNNQEVNHFAFSQER